MKRVLLLNTPFYRLMGSHYNGLSLGLLYIASVLRDANHEVGVLNADHEDATSYLDQRGIFDGFDTYKRIHEDEGHHIWEGTVRDILAFNPDFLGITMYTANFKAARIISQKVKRENNDIKIVVGGIHPTLASYETLKAEEFDYVIAGEGEFPFLKLVNDTPEDRIAGLGYRDGGTPVLYPRGEFIPDLDSLPFPARDLVINSSNSTDYGQLISGRGCPFSCSYCASATIWKRTVRFRSVENVMKELITIKENYPHDVIYFEDDTFTLRPDRTIELCDQIIKRGLDIRWKCDTRADCLNDEMVRFMKRAGCICIKMGAESGSEKVLKSINKKLTKDIISRAAKTVKKHGIALTVYLMAGFPRETDEDLIETINFAKQLDADYYSLSVVAPYYGTNIYDEYVRNNGRLGKEHWEYFYHQSQEMIMNDNLSQDIIGEFLSLNEGKKRT